MLASIYPGHELATANFILVMAGAFTAGLPMILIAGNRSSITKTLIPLSAEELAYEIEIFGWINEEDRNYLES